MKSILIPLFTLIFFSANAQSLYQQARDYQDNLDMEFGDEEKSPLTAEDYARFDVLPFFDIDTSYVVIVDIELTPTDSVFEMRTTTSRLAKYRRYGIITFSLQDSIVTLNVYENMRLKQMPKYKDYLFLPFKDLTNGNDTYGGGRYVEPVKMDENKLMIDFNRAYNPYCAYNDRYSCPIVPQENFVNLRIEAGVKAPKDH